MGISSSNTRNWTCKGRHYCWRSGWRALWIKVTGAGGLAVARSRPGLRTGSCKPCKQLPLESLAQWLPKDFAWQGVLNADLQLDLPAGGPKGQVMVDASGGALRIREKEQWVDFPYQALKLNSSLTPKRVDTQLDFRGGKLGELMVQTQINPLAKNKPLSGE